MRIIIEKDLFLKNLKFVDGAVDKTKIETVLEAVSIESDKDTGSVKLSGNNMENYIETTIYGNVKESGALKISYKKLSDIIITFPSKDIILDYENGVLTIQSDSINNPAKHTIQCLIHDDIEARPFQENNLIEIDIKLFISILKKCKCCVSIEEARYFLQGINFFKELDQNNLRISSTDGKRLVVMRVADDYFSDINYRINAMVPTKSINNIVNIAKSKMEEGLEKIKFGFSSSAFYFQADNTMFSSNLVDTDFMKIDSVIPEDNEYIFSINTDFMRTAINVVSAILPKDDKKLKFTFEEDKLRIESKNENDKSIYSIDINNKYSEFLGKEIGLNYTYIKDAINNIDSPLFKIMLKNPNSPILIEPDDENENSLQFIIGPMRLD